VSICPRSCQKKNIMRDTVNPPPKEKKRSSRGCVIVWEWIIPLLLI
jgi:hypothetical protein